MKKMTLQNQYLTWENSQYHGFPAKWPLRNKCRNSILMIWKELLIGWSKFSSWDNQSEALRLPGWWCIISMEFLHLFLRHHFVRKPVAASWNVGCFLRHAYLNHKGDSWNITLKEPKMYSLVISNTGYLRRLMLLKVFNNRLNVFCTNLTFVDMIIGVNRFFGSHFSSHQFNGPVTDHFINVHVRLGTRTSLPHHQWKVIL